MCVQGETTLFYTVTMEFIIILMMLQLRRVSAGWQLRGRFLLSFLFSVHAVYPIMLAGGFAVLLAHTCSDKQAVAAAAVVGGNWR